MGEAYEPVASKPATRNSFAALMLEDESWVAEII